MITRTQQIVLDSKSDKPKKKKTPPVRNAVTVVQYIIKTWEKCPKMASGVKQSWVTDNYFGFDSTYKEFWSN